MISTRQTSHRATATRDARRVRRLLNDVSIRLFHPSKAHEAGIFRAKKTGAELIAKLSVHAVEILLDEGALEIVRQTKAGFLYRAVLPKDRIKPARTAKERRSAAWQTAERAFSKPVNETGGKLPIAIADSPIGWLARRRDANGNPYLNRDEVAAAERLRSDFERGQMAPGVTQDWKRFLTSGVEGGARVSPQERDVDGGASAARDRLSDALFSLGPGLADIAIRVCCFLEGIEAIETSMHWSRRSGKVVLKIALQRLAIYYEELSVRNSAVIEAWQSDERKIDRSMPSNAPT